LPAFPEREVGKGRPFWTRRGDSLFYTLGVKVLRVGRFFLFRRRPARVRRKTSEKEGGKGEKGKGEKKKTPQKMRRGLLFLGHPWGRVLSFSWGKEGSTFHFQETL